MPQVVATREGGVDRNPWTDDPILRDGKVATREGGVDRNTVQLRGWGQARRSPPARVAWIETLPFPFCTIKFGVATREGGVDRNFVSPSTRSITSPSPPARVAWIETLS